MKKLILALFFINFVIVSAYAQKTESASQEERKLFLGNTEIRNLQEHFRKQGFSQGKFNEEGTKRITGKDAKGNVDITLMVYTVTSTQKAEIDLVLFKNNLDNSSMVWAENDDNGWQITKGKVVSRPKSPAVEKSLTTCLQKYATQTQANCNQCTSCVNNCINSNKKWWKKALCATFSCGNSCLSCITNVYRFVLCLLGR